ncbi:hypothetical protein TSOC_004216 [Tetrabaena socialis]|uniref:Uncharacterized protein n=1 Tax=Tetrabaena socialis TaxID=47790 RepID=A0A2J8A9G0_9CHLO|nr:hypothetical protein TSOC_004216 [Tetrabaena socialis]|eukprot:PNH09167.1 hypothetical protein TSOC_004216 [Tetrabaena socialis]
MNGSAGYPRNLSYLVKRLSGYSQNCFKLQALNQTTASAGQVVTCDMPLNSLVDFDNVLQGLHFDLCRCEMVIERLEVEINGQLIGSGCSMYNQLWSIIADTTLGEDVTNRRKVLQGSSDIVAAPTANITNQQFAIQNWLGFLGSCKPSILDTSILGNVRLRLTLAGPQILAMSAAGAGAGYTLSDIFFSIDTISIDDGLFYQMHQNFLQAGNLYEIPFNSFYSFTSTGGMSQSCKFSLSTQSLNRCWGCFITGANYPLSAAPTTGAFLDPITLTAPYFTRLGNAGTVAYGTATNNTPVTYALQSYQFNVKGVYSPNWRPDTNQAYALLMNSYNLSQDTLGGGNKLLDSLSKWNSGFWVCCQEFEHGSDDYISGIDTRGSVASCFWQCQGSITVGGNVGTGGINPGSSLTALIFVQTTSILRVGAGRQIELVM